jgi:hypothetical protein
MSRSLLINGRTTRPPSAQQRRRFRFEILRFVANMRRFPGLREKDESESEMV